MMLLQKLPLPVKLWAVALLPLFMLATVSCGDSTKEDITPPKFTVSGSTSVTIPAEGGSGSVTFTAPYAWRASSDADWLTFSPTNGGAGEAKVTVKAGANETDANRSAVVTVSAEGVDSPVRISVSQAFVQKAEPAKPSIKLTPTELSFTAEGGKAEIKATAVGEWAVTATESWFSVDKQSIKDGEFVITVTAKANETYEELDGEVVFTCGNESSSVTLTQDAAEEPEEPVQPSIKLTPTELSFTADGGKAEIKATAVGEWAVTATESWFSVDKQSIKDGEFVITVTAKANETYEELDGEVVFTCGNESSSVTITQDAAEEPEEPEEPITMDLGAKEVSVDSYGGEAEVSVTLNKGAEVTATVDNGAFHLDVNPDDESLMSWSILVSADENATGKVISGTVTVKAGDLVETFVVSQEPIPVEAEAAEPRVTLSPYGETKVVKIDMNYSWSIELGDSPSWLSVELTSGSETVPVKIIAGKNESGADRSGTLKFKVAGTKDVVIAVSQGVPSDTGDIGGGINGWGDGQEADFGKNN